MRKTTPRKSIKIDDKWISIYNKRAHLDVLQIAIYLDTFPENLAMHLELYGR